MTPLLNRRALLALGYTPALIAAILAAPDKVQTHTHGMRRWTEHLYTRERVTAGMQDPRFLALIAKRAKRKQSAAARLAAIPARYADWRAALPEAGEGMFSLNRYAKHRACGELRRHEIYSLKNELIELLYRHGYSTAAWLHKLPAQMCRVCAGEGDGCDHCDGSGVWRPASTIWCFRFRIGGRDYCWHQPRELVAFVPDESLPPQDWVFGGEREKPVALAKARFARVLELLRWVIARAYEESVEAALPFERAASFERFPCLNENDCQMSMSFDQTLDDGVAC